MKGVWMLCALMLVLLAAPSVAQDVKAPTFPINLCGWYCWDSLGQACWPIIWVMQSNKTFSDNEFNDGTWSFGGGKLTMTYSGGAVYIGTLRQGRAFDGTMSTPSLDGEWSAAIGDFGCNQPFAPEGASAFYVDASGD